MRGRSRSRSSSREYRALVSIPLASETDSAAVTEADKFAGQVGAHLEFVTRIASHEDRVAVWEEPGARRKNLPTEWLRKIGFLEPDPDRRSDLGRRLARGGSPI